MMKHPLEGLPSRISLVVSRSGLNQSEFARKLGISPGFMSDVLRGQKKPGAEFFYAMSDVFSVSADWLLTGKGTVNGASGIDMTFMKTIELHIALAKSAVFENNSTAKLLLHMAKEGRLDEIESDPEFGAFFKQISLSSPEHELAFDIYNSQLWTSDPDAQIKNSLAAALSWTQSRKPLNPHAALGGDNREGHVTQVINQSGNKVAGRDFYEK
ncbi:transcriptional regulator with XRE-family HTH domain [Leclercia adecarboxylata]|uniref:helix-turn-helix domain-containing protein n=1 Tax=Leclercia adecarboxylata TaxID=83655 RepID=UPI002473178B|nr:helix-turn-helix transcriptional regulator [Leclercia adecarboxylata]MDH6164788.1 transcriptional regulator with XRE-family HTH domain [Leclercia adecarboxylata]